ncbi:MAG: SH3 domain-containing protein [Clostridia bacterium]
MNKIKKLKYIITIVVLLAIVFTNKVSGATGKVTTETLNLRSEPSTSSSVIELLNADEEVEILSEEGNWYKVKYGSKEGYVSKDYVEVDEDLEKKDTTTSSAITGNETTTPNTTNNTSENNIIANNGIVTVKNDTTIKILPLINASSIGELKSGEEIEIITSANKWVFIQTDELSGWILNPNTEFSEIPLENNEDENTEQEPENSSDESQITDSQEDEKNGEETSENNSDTTYTESSIKYVNASSVYVRSAPSTDANVVTILIRDTDVTVTGENGDWYKVKYGDYAGYIYKDLLSNTKTETTNRSSTEVSRTANISSESQVAEASNTTLSKGEEIVEYAKQYLGCPYVYGGSGSSSFDCSGFTMYVYKNFGYSLSHSAIAQSKVGTYVEKENLQPGDLVFFLEWDTMDEIGHCGIYIGDGDFIHASSGTGYCVKISNLNSGSYCTRYATARRLL